MSGLAASRTSEKKESLIDDSSNPVKNGKNGKNWRLDNRLTPRVTCAFTAVFQMSESRRPVTGKGTASKRYVNRLVNRILRVSDIKSHHEVDAAFCAVAGILQALKA